MRVQGQLMQKISLFAILFALASGAAFAQGRGRGATAGTKWLLSL